MFDIKVALLGHVSVGKTTILNALLQDKYSEVKKTRTTAAVNRFHLSPSPSSVATDGTSITSTAASPYTEHHPTATSSSAETAAAADAASCVLEKITQANKRLRLSSSGVEEHSFSVEMKEPLCDNMRDDTQLVLIDIPGLNEQGSREKYKTYVRHRWNTWDCVVLVMDATQGVNSEEQVELLETIKHHFDHKKKIPIVILCNKYDNPDEVEDKALVEEVRKKIETVFKVTCRSQALDELLLSNPDGSVDDDDLAAPRSLYPAFVPIAAAKAFLYRAASRMTLEEFQQERTRQRFNIEELVRDEVGRAHKDSPEKRYKLAYEVISDPLQYQERLASTNFDKFLTVLARSVGGADRQRCLIHKQLLVDLNEVTLEEFLGGKVQALADKHNKVLGTPSGHIRTRFWFLFHSFLETAFKNYRQDMDLSGLSKAADLLCNYIKLSDTLTPTREEEARDVFQALGRLLKFQCHVIEEKARGWRISKAAFMNRWIRVGNKWSHHGTEMTVQGKTKSPPLDSPFHWERTTEGWKNKYSKVEKEVKDNPATAKATWQNLSPYDWNLIIGSVLLLSYSRHFVEHLGQEKVRLEFLNKVGMFATFFNSSYCVNCASEPEKKARNDLAIYTEREYQNGKLIPSHPVGYASVFQVQQPYAMSDPAHWGHVGWRFCTFAERSSFSVTDVQVDYVPGEESAALEVDTADVALPSKEEDVADHGDY